MMTGLFTNEDALNLQAEINPTAQKHTDVLVRVAGDGRSGLGSGVHIRWRDRDLLVSCDHVLRPDHRYFSLAERLERDMIDETSAYRVESLALIDSNESLDLSVFDTTGRDLSRSKKERYDLSRSEKCTYSEFSGEVGLAACLYGLWSEKTRGHVYPDGLFYMNAPIYTAVGPITRVEPDLIVCDMAEKELLYRNDSHPLIKGTQLTGGARDLSGSSGSGLWVCFNGVPTILGIVLGRQEPCPPDAHLMRFTPVWSLRKWLDAIL